VLITHQSSTIWLNLPLACITSLAFLDKVISDRLYLIYFSFMFLSLWSPRVWWRSLMCQRENMHFLILVWH
jgi:hypothetical protein